MRATTLTALVTLMLAGTGHGCLAQTAPADPAGSPQALTGADGSDRQASEPADSQVLKNYPIAAPAKPAAPSSAEQARQRNETDRVGALSPDEERRAARARARAVAAEAPAAKTADVRAAHADTHPVESRVPARTEALAAAKPRLPVIKVAPPALPHATETASVSADPYRHATRKRVASAAVHPAPLRAHARFEGRVIAGDVARGPRVGDMVSPDVELAPVPPRYRQVAGLYEHRSVVVDGGPGYGPRGPMLYPPRPGWYPPPPPYGYPYPRFGY